MEPRFIGRWLCALAAYLAACVSMRAPAMNYYYWTSYNIDNSWTNNANWLTGVSTGLAPTVGNGVAAGTADIIFDSANTRSDIFLDASQSIRSLNITSLIDDDVEFKATSGATLTIQSWLTFSPSSSYRWFRFDKSLGIVLPGIQTWQVDTGTVNVAGIVSGAGGITKDGSGDLLLQGNNTFTSGVTLNSGYLSIGHDSALGTGTLTLNGGTLRTNWGPRTIGNAITLTCDTTIDTYRGALEASGAVTLAYPAITPSVTLTINGWAPVKLTGAISESVTYPGQTLIKAGSGTLILAGASNTTTGGAIVYNGKLIFLSAAALPTTGTLFVDSDGYVGANLTTEALRTGFINSINPSSTGAFGFESAATIGENIDLTGLGSANTARLGSATSATITGTITPQNLTYRFGSGGGTLFVQSSLTDTGSARSVSVGSAPNQPLTLVLSGPNTYTGGTTVNNSLLRFANSSALPASGSISISNGSYLGFDYASSLDLSSITGGSFLSDLASRIPIGSNFVLGLDSSTISTAIDLSNFTTRTSTVYLGTSTTTTLSGAITPTGSASAPYLFASVKGGQLTIASTLTGTRGVEIGSYALVGSGIGNSPQGFVALTANNSYSGGTTFYNGVLRLGHNNALGTGSLTISSNNPNDAFLETSAAGLVIGNSVSVPNPGGTLNVGGPNNFTLNGNITGSGGIRKFGPDTLTLNGTNTFSYLSIDQGTVAFANCMATGGAILKISEAATADFLSGALIPVISGLEGEPGAIVNLSSTTTLTINVPDKNRFAGVIQGSGGIVFNGPGLLELGAGPDQRLHDGTTPPPPSTFSGGTTINNGTVELRNSSALGTDTVEINGGKLSLDLGVTFTNPINFNSGAIGGFGTFAPANETTFSIGSFNTLAPGLHESAIGYLNFENGLVLASGGTYAWNIAYAGGVNGPAGDGIVWDQIKIVSGDLQITAISETPFNLVLSTTDLLGNNVALPTFDNTIGHSWAIAVVNAGTITGFVDPAAFAINTTGFLNPLGIGTFSVSLSGDSRSLMLNFTPVPEPSTWALLLCGAGAVLFPALKRRKSEIRISKSETNSKHEKRENL